MNQLKTRQICLFFIAFVPVTKLFILPSIIAKSSGSDMWISCLLNVLFDTLSIMGVCFACKRANCDFFTLIENCFGKTGFKIIMILYALAFFLKALVPVNDLRNYVEITLYETIPSSIYFLPFFIVSFYLCTKPLRVLGRCADIMWLVTLTGIAIILALSVSNVDFTNLLPLGVNGTKKIFSGSFSSWLWYGDCVYFMFFIGNFTFKKKDGIKIVLSYVLSGVVTVLFMIFFYCIFTSIAGRQTYSLTEISKYSTVINNIGRFDYIGIGLILFSTVIATSLPIYFCVLCVKKAFNIQIKWRISLAVNGLLTLIIILLKEHFFSIERFVMIYGNLIFILLFNLIPLVSVLLTIKEKRHATIKT